MFLRGKEDMKYVVRMFNDVNCMIDSDIIEASDENEALEIFKKEHFIIEYAGDRYEVEEY